jgi:Rrf2 family protein
MHVTAKADYAVRAVIELADSSHEAPRKVDDIAAAQSIPVSFLENILTQLRSAGVVRSQRGPEGGYWLAKPADDITLADVIRAVEGPIANVQSAPPESIHYRGHAEHLREVWIAVRANLRAVLETTTLADLTSGKLPPVVEHLAESPDAWEPR